MKPVPDSLSQQADKLAIDSWVWVHVIDHSDTVDTENISELEYFNEIIDNCKFWECG